MKGREIFPCVLIILVTSAIYLAYTHEFNVTVPDGWPAIYYSVNILEGDTSPLWDAFLRKRPIGFSTHYFFNALGIRLFGLQGIYVNVFFHIAISSLLLFLYFRNRIGTLVGLTTALIFLLYPSVTNQTAVYMANYYRALTLTLVALLCIDKSIILSSLSLLLSLWIVESPSILILIHPFLVHSDWSRNFRRSAGVYFLTMLLYAIWRFYLFPIYYGDVDAHAQSFHDPVRYVYNLVRGVFITFFISHSTLYEYFSSISLFHILVGIPASLVIWTVLRRISNQGSIKVKLDWVDFLSRKYRKRAEPSDLGTLSRFPRFRVIFIVGAIVCFSMGYVMDLDFVSTIARPFSPDGVLEPQTLAEIGLEMASLRVLLVLLGILFFMMSTSWGLEKLRNYWRRLPIKEFGINNHEARDIGHNRIHLFFLFLTGILFVFLGYAYAFFGGAAPASNPLGELSRSNLVGSVGASLAIAALFALCLTGKLKGIALGGLSLYLGLLVAYHLQLQDDAAEMGRLQRKIWNEIIDQAPDLTGKTCLIMLVPDTINVRLGRYLNDWDGSPDIPTRIERPLVAARAFKGITWAENVALKLLYGPEKGSQVILLTHEEFKAFLTDQEGFLGPFQPIARGHGGAFKGGVYRGYSSGQVLLFEYGSGRVRRKYSFNYEQNGEMFEYDGFGSDVVGSKLDVNRKFQKKMRKLLLRRDEV